MCEMGVLSRATVLDSLVLLVRVAMGRWETFGLWPRTLTKECWVVDNLLGRRSVGQTVCWADVCETTRGGCHGRDWVF